MCPITGRYPLSSPGSNCNRLITKPVQRLQKWHSVHSPCHTNYVAATKEKEPHGHKYLHSELICGFKYWHSQIYFSRTFHQEEIPLCILYSSLPSSLLFWQVFLWRAGKQGSPRKSLQARETFWFGSIVTISPRSRSGVERHDGGGCGRCPTSSAPQRQHGRLWESDGKPGFDGLPHITASSSPTAGKWNLNLGSLVTAPNLPNLSGFTLDP